MYNIGIVCFASDSYLWWKLECMPIIVNVRNDDSVKIIILICIEYREIEQHEVDEVNPLKL